MKRLRSYIIILALLVTSLQAQSCEGEFYLNNIGEKADTKFDVHVTAKYKMSILMGEPVIDLRVKYTIGSFLSIDGKSYNTDKFPKEIINNSAFAPKSKEILRSST